MTCHEDALVFAYLFPCLLDAGYSSALLVESKTTRWTKKTQYLITKKPIVVFYSSTRDEFLHSDPLKWIGALLSLFG